MMKFESIQYQCELSHKFDSFALPEDSYGEFLLWSANGENSYLDAVSDKTYDEVSNLINSHRSEVRLADDDLADILQRVYGQVACDPDSEGAKFSILAHQPCPICGTSKMKSWDYKSPAETVNMEPARVTHKVWAKLSETEKAVAVTKALLLLKK